MSARDIAATVRNKLDKALDRPLTLAERRFASEALAALEKQAADAQVARAVAEDAKALWDDANKRAVRAEEALRQIADERYDASGHEEGRGWAVTLEWIWDRADEALAAAGADTHGYIDVEEGRP